MPFTVPEIPLRWAPSRKGLLEPAQRVHVDNRSAAAGEAAEQDPAKTNNVSAEVEEGELDEDEHKAAREAKEELRRYTLPHIVNRIEKKTFNNYPSLLFSAPEDYESLVAWLGQPYKHGDFRLPGSECQAGWALEKELADVFSGVSGDPEHDIPYDAQVNSKNVWQWAADDWTVVALPFNAKYPWRPFCEGPPGSATDSGMPWATLSPADCMFYPYRVWHGLTRARVRPRAGEKLAKEYQKVKAAVLALLPKCDLPAKTFDELVPAWTREFAVDVLDRPMDMLFHQLSWLRLQRKLRDLKGIENFLTTHLTVHPQYSPRTMVHNFVGVRFESEWRAREVSGWACQGVAVLEPVWSVQAGKLVLRRHSEEYLRKTNRLDGIAENTPVLELSALSERQRHSRAKGSSAVRKSESKKRKASAMEDLAEDARMAAGACVDRVERTGMSKASEQFEVSELVPDESIIGFQLPQPYMTDAVGYTPPSDAGRVVTWDEPAAGTWDEPACLPVCSASEDWTRQGASTQVSLEAIPKRKLTWQELVAEKKAKKAAEMGA